MNLPLELSIHLSVPPTWFFDVSVGVTLVSRSKYQSFPLSPLKKSPEVTPARSITPLDETSVFISCFSATYLLSVPNMTPRPFSKSELENEYALSILNCVESLVFVPWYEVVQV